MSFWHTFVGKAIHHVSGGFIGKGGHHNTGPKDPIIVPNSSPGDCITDMKFYATHVSECMPTSTVGGGGSGIGTHVPVSSVPEPSSAAMVLCAFGVFFLWNRFSKKK